MNFEALAKNSVVMTNERSVSEVSASAPVGTTDKLSIFYLTCLVFHQFPAAQPYGCLSSLHHLFAKASQLVRSKLIVC
jgi:hypothetical protein